MKKLVTDKTAAGTEFFAVDYIGSELCPDGILRWITCCQVASRQEMAKPAGASL